jgi:hypothetical protein
MVGDTQTFGEVIIITSTIPIMEIDIMDMRTREGEEMDIIIMEDLLLEMIVTA